MEFEKLLKERRSATFFDKNKDLTNDLIKEIIDLSVLAPSAFNTQPWELIIVKSPKARKDLYEKACKQPKVLDAPVTLAIIGKKNGYKRDNPIWDEKIKNKILDNESLQSYMDMCENSLYNSDIKKTSYAVRNASLFAMTIMFVAKSKGVSTHPMIGFNEEAVKELYSISKDKVVVMLISMGYFDEEKKLFPREKRFSFEKISKIY
ncbi:nitroreductase family protein [uncultured Ilyobacter sp.]|uniref:nitroreductase family protein n=1 Tax=uncultured Ilyobacter sp. TaxID=544433 RepID=UPI0029C8F68C|nr:nitroreductase family protein [uncultured Ilyobacter sp.]